jgi:mycoredoxin
VIYSMPRNGVLCGVVSRGVLTLYTTSWCGYCVRLKHGLARAGVTYDEVNIEHDETAADVVSELNGGSRTVPTVVFPDGRALANPTVDQVVSQLCA